MTLVKESRVYGDRACTKAEMDVQVCRLAGTKTKKKNKKKKKKKKKTKRNGSISKFFFLRFQYFGVTGAQCCNKRLRRLLA